MFLNMNCSKMFLSLKKKKKDNYNFKIYLDDLLLWM